MKLFLDTANVREIRRADSWGVLDGVTTNPSLAAREGRDFKDLALEICDILGDRPVNLEVVSTDAEGMMEEARLLASWADNVVVKIPMLPEGLKAVRALGEEDIPTNVTLVFSVNQGLLAAKAGCTFTSPFLGRVDDAGQDGVAIVRDLAQVYEMYGFESEVLAASIRHPQHVIAAAKAGADIATLPYGVLEKMTKHPLTDAGLERFLADWRQVPDHETIFELS